MSPVALYPGSFDPITKGHEELARRASQLFDTVVVAVVQNPSKAESYFSLEERKTLVKETLSDVSNIEVISFDGLTVEAARNVGATAIIRGLRAVTDFDYECSMSHMNHTLAPELHTVFLMASLDYQFLSSRLVRQVARYGQSVESLVPACVNEALTQSLQVRSSAV